MPALPRACPTTASATSCPEPCSTTPARAGWAWASVSAWVPSWAAPTVPPSACKGDGGFLYTSQELNTAVRKNIPLVSIVLNNGCHGAEKAQQQRFYDQKYIGVDLENPRFDKLAEVYGAKGYYVERPEDVAETVRDALTLDGPSVVEIPVAEYFPPGATLSRA